MSGKATARPAGGMSLFKTRGRAGYGIHCSLFKVLFSMEDGPDAPHYFLVASKYQ